MERSTPRRRSGGILARKNGSVEAEEGRSEVCFRPFTGVWLELGLDVDDEGGADRREQIVGNKHSDQCPQGLLDTVSDELVGPCIV